MLAFHDTITQGNIATNLACPAQAMNRSDSLQRSWVQACGSITIAVLHALDGLRACGIVNFNFSSLHLPEAVFVYHTISIIGRTRPSSYRLCRSWEAQPACVTTIGHCSPCKHCSLIQAQHQQRRLLISKLTHREQSKACD